MSDVLIILGMHRSGTSLLARYLAEAGVFMGHALLDKHVTNPAGHYEDLDFLGWHQAILEAHDTDYKVTEQIRWNIDPSFLQRAEKLIADRRTYVLWGWKDPRTCLFLDFWKDLLPGARYLVCYREYLPVITSLIRRDLTFYHERTSRFQRIRHPRFTPDGITRRANLYLKVWIHYNREILAHIQTPGVCSLVFPFEEMTREAFSFSNALDPWNLPLQPVSGFRASSSRSGERQELNFELESGFVATADGLARRFIQHFENTGS